MSVVVDRLDSLITLIRNAFGVGGDAEVISQPLDSHTPNSDRSLATTRTKIGVSGTLQSVNVRIISGVPRVGQVYCRVVLEDENQQEKATLCRGYDYPGHEVYGIGALPVRAGDQIRLETRSAVASIILRPVITAKRGVHQPGGWTGTDKGSLEGPGNNRAIVGTNPAAGAQVSETVPTNARWLIRTLYFTLTASGSTATRQVQLFVDDASNVFWNFMVGATQTASQAREYLWGLKLGVETTAFRDVSLYLPLPEIIIPQAYRIRTVISAGDGADNWAAPNMLVEEWIEE